jgi:hypothetical protein
MAEKSKLVQSTLKTNRETFAAPFVAADYDAAVFTSPEGMAPTVDAMFTTVMALGANVWAIQRRMRVMEILMEKHGKVTRDMIEQYMPTAEEKEQLQKDRNAFVAELYDPFKMMGSVHYGASIDVPDATVKKAL